MINYPLVVNPLTPGVHEKVIHTYTNLQLSFASLFKYIWPFDGHEALKDWNIKGESTFQCTWESNDQSSKWTSQFQSNASSLASACRPVYWLENDILINKKFNSFRSLLLGTNQIKVLMWRVTSSLNNNRTEIYETFLPCYHLA